MSVHILKEETSHTDVNNLLAVGEVALYPFSGNWYGKTKDVAEVPLGLTPAQVVLLNNALQSGDNISLLTNDSNYQTDTQVSAAVSAAINNLIDGAPVTLDTLNEIAAAIADDENFATTITTLISNHVGDLANPHAVTQTQVGLGNVDNTSDLNKPVSTAQQTALDLKYDATNPANYQTLVNMNAAITAAINNLIDGAPVTLDTLNELAAAIADDDDFATTITTLISNHTSDLANPHVVTQTQVGLGNVDNTSDLNKPVSTAQQTALDLKYDNTNPAGYQTLATMNAAITAAINNLIDGAPVTLDTLNEIAAAIADDDDFATTITTLISNHTSDLANPHVVTKTQVGLGNVDNTSDVNKPVSTAQQTALNAKYDVTNPAGYETPTQLTSRDNANRLRSNHSGTQLANTISDFATTVLNTVLTGFAVPVSAIVSSTDTVLAAFGKLQAQINSLFDYTLHVVTQTGHGFTLTGGIPLPAYTAPGGIVLAQADNANTLTAHYIIDIPDANTLVIAVGTRRHTVTGHGLTVGQYYFLSDTTAGDVELTLDDRAIKDVCFYVLDANTLILKDNRPFEEDTFLNYACKVTNTDISTNINNATPTSVPLNGTLAFNDSTDLYSPEGNGIRVLEAMAAKIRGHFHYTSTGQRVALEGQIYVNGSPVGNITANGYIRAANGHNRASNTVSDTIVLAANDLVEIFAIRESTLTTSTTLAALASSSLYIERK